LRNIRFLQQQNEKDKKGNESTMNSQSFYVKAIRALAGRAEVYHIIGALQKSKADFERVIKLSRDGDYKRDALIGLGQLCSELGEYDQELLCANRLLRFTRKMDLLSKGKALTVKAGALRDKGNYESSLKTSRRSISLYRSARKNAMHRRGGHRSILQNISNAYNTMGMVNNIQGRYGSALANFKKRLNIGKKINDQIAIAQSLNNIGLIYWHNSKMEMAEKYFHKSLGIAQRVGYKNAVSVILGNIGLINNDLGKYDIALEYFLKAIKIGEEVGNKAGTAAHLLNAGLCYENLCDFSNAFKYYTLSLGIFQKVGNIPGTAMALLDLGMNHCDRGDYKTALDYLNNSEKIALHADLLEIVIRCSAMKGKVLRGCKEYAKSIKFLKNGVGLAKKYKMEDLKILSVKEYVKTAIEEKSKKHLAVISKYMAMLENVYKGADAGKDKGMLLIIFIKYDMAREKYKDAGKKLIELSDFIKQLDNQEFTAEALFVQAQFNRAMGREYADQIIKAKDLAKELGYNFLLDEINDMFKETT
jgi:tetratricopeptide (TPR) repeat protein